MPRQLHDKYRPDTSTFHSSETVVTSSSLDTMFAIGPALVTLLGAYVLYSLITLFQNSQIAKRIGFPIAILLYKDSPIMYMLRPAVRLDFLIKRLPEAWRDWLWFHTSWLRYHTLNRVHARYGPVFTAVAPGKGSLYLIIADPEVALQIGLKRWEKPEIHYSK